jgi:hypothetical protein
VVQSWNGQRLEEKILWNTKCVQDVVGEHKLKKTLREIRLETE